MGPLSRFAEYKGIEVNEFGRALQQVRFPPTRLADSSRSARGALFMLPGAKYMDPELSWKYEWGPAGTAFVRGAALGAHNERHAVVRVVARSSRSAGPADPSTACGCRRVARKST